MNRLADGLPVDPTYAKKFKIKRRGKDKDDIFYAFGKVHGLENVGLADKEEILATKGNPIALQKLVDKVNDSEKPLPPASPDQLVEEIYNNLSEYKNVIEAMDQKKEFNPSDKKKLLALPFLLSKRTALPEPRYGQKEWALFEKLYGRPWNAYEGINFDEQEKITEYNYEEFIPKHLLNGIDTQSDDFKKSIKVANFNSKTDYEQHQADQ